MADSSKNQGVNEIPDGVVDPGWEYWQGRAVFLRAFGKLHKQIAADPDVDVTPEAVCRWLRKPEAQHAVREIRKEQLSIMYGGALAIAEKAKESLIELLTNKMGVLVEHDGGMKRLEVAVPANVRVQAISLAYKICGDAAAAIQGEEVAPTLKLAEEAKALRLRRPA